MSSSAKAPEFAHSLSAVHAELSGESDRLSKRRLLTQIRFFNVHLGGRLNKSLDQHNLLASPEIIISRGEKNLLKSTKY